MTLVIRVGDDLYGIAVLGDHRLDTVLYRHAPHLIDTVRLLGGGRVRGVRGSVGRWMRERPCAGNVSAYLEFEDGTPATIAYNGYGFFDTSELTWGIGNRLYSDEQRVVVRRALRDGTFDSDAAKEEMRFGAVASDGASAGNGGSSSAVGTRAHIGWFGVTVASFECGDIRQSPNGLYVYGEAGRPRCSRLRRSRNRDARDARDVRMYH